MIPRTPHSTIMATQTPIIPKPKVIPNIYPRMTRNSHIDSNDAIDVNFESPAARKADGIIKLGGQRRGCAIATIMISVKIVGIISSGGLNSWINIGNKGINSSAAATKTIEESPINE